MTVFMLDTNIAIKAMKRREPILYENIGRAIDDGHTLSISVITLHELRVGLLRNSNISAAISKHEAFMIIIDKIWNFEPADAEIASLIRANLLKTGPVIGSLDTLIAGQAARLGLPLVTTNVGEFSRIPDLEIQDWTKP
jgi:tRNA(fMet)-specific endonuclease VapC